MHRNLQNNIVLCSRNMLKERGCPARRVAFSTEIVRRLLIIRIVLQEVVSPTTLSHRTSPWLISVKTIVNLNCKTQIIIHNYHEAESWFDVSFWHSINLENDISSDQSTNGTEIIEFEHFLNDWTNLVPKNWLRRRQ